jgi:predicted patatin/cPLA2 family phospholipase
MRGVVSAAMAGALERMDLTPCFDLVVGSSAGAINGAALLAGAAERAAEAYCGPLASRSFVNPLRVLRGKPVLDVNDVLGVVSGFEAGHRQIVAGPAELHCIATDVETAQPVDLTGMDNERDVWTAILASSRMPWAGGPPVEFRGRRFLDGGMAAAVPVAQALAAGATHILALQTRPFGVARKSASGLGDRLIERHLRGLNPALVTLYRERIALYEDVVADLERRTLDPAPPFVLGVRPPLGTPCVGQLERRPEILTRAATESARLVEEALDVNRYPARSPGPR